ncbi:MAG: hypothetical protein AB9888_15210 [Bacteroidales bacterium]
MFGIPSRRSAPPRWGSLVSQKYAGGVSYRKHDALGRRADFNGVPFWSGAENTCTLPGCTSAQVVLPGGGKKQVVIQYQYDALNRLKAAEYDNGLAFRYTLDAAGNTLMAEKSLNGQTVRTRYTYDADQQLASARENDGPRA